MILLLPPLRGGGALFLFYLCPCRGEAFFSLVGKEAKAPSRDVPSLENPLHYMGILLRYDLGDCPSRVVPWAARRRSAGGCALAGNFDCCAGGAVRLDRD